MRRILMCVTCAVLLIVVSCKKVSNTSCPYTASSVVAPSVQSDSLQTLLADSGITNAVKDTAGFFYTIDSLGTGASISNVCQSINVTYKATFFGGKKLDSTATGQIANFQLGQVIVGWQKGVPLIKAGGGITLFLPPALAYGSTNVGDNSGNVIIPANSYLIFHIQLLSVE